MTPSDPSTPPASAGTPLPPLPITAENPDRSTGSWCGRCGAAMRHNVPRIGPEGGYVHAATGHIECADQPHHVSDISSASASPQAQPTKLPWMQLREALIFECGNTITPPLIEKLCAQLQTPNVEIPPLVDGPRRVMLVQIEVSAAFESRLDNQWEVEREIQADRWSWMWADRCKGVAPHIPDAPKWRGLADRLAEALQLTTDFIQNEIYQEVGGHETAPEPADELSYKSVGHLQANALALSAYKATATDGTQEKK